ncbi:MAG: NAD(P)H-binding protein [Nitrospirota bacterium]|nr:NAD(P)H-binding protein [Nitrospirota bacterium]
MEQKEHTAEDRVLVLGATGFVGGRLIPELIKKNVKLRLFVRDPAKVASIKNCGADIEVFQGDLLSGEGVEDALNGTHTAYYLVHSMGGKSIFKNTEYAEKDKQAARNFIAAANQEGLKRVIYLGALGERGDNLSEHLRSRAEVAAILSSGKPAATILRAAIIIGAGGASFEMLRYLVERLPVMGCPKWIDTRIQPIALRDVLAYLVGVLLNPQTKGQTYDIGGDEILTYREMMQQYAEARGIPRRIIFRVPFLTPLLSAYWVDLVTPIPSGVAHPLIDGLKNEVICRDDRIDEFVPIEKTSFKEAVKIAFSEEKDGPGITGF